MANFRAERLFIRVSGYVEGFDPNGGIDADEFAWIAVSDTDTYERRSLRDFVFAPFQRPLWFAAAEGLESVRGRIAEFEAELKTCDEERRTSLERSLETLHAVEDRLDRLDTKDLQFYFLARDLA